MKYLGRFLLKKNNLKFYGEYNPEKKLVCPIESIFFPNKTGASVSIDEVDPVLCVNPSKIIAIGKNYKAHIEEFDSQTPEEPLIFLKAKSSLIGPNEKIIKPTLSKKVEYEGEIAVVISKEAHKIKEENALKHVLGVICANDVTARDIQRKDGQWARGKSFNTFCPVGPWILPSKYISDFNNLEIKTFLNGKMVQNAKSNLMLFKIPFIISYISQAMTLYPGDIILTGTPAGVGDLKENDVVTVEISGLGQLINTVVSE